MIGPIRLYESCLNRVMPLEMSQLQEYHTFKDLGRGATPPDGYRKIRVRYKIKLKGVGPIEYHLGCDFYRDSDGTLCVGPKRYVEKMLGAYERMFGEMPYQYSSPLEKNDHPELDKSRRRPCLGSSVSL